MQRFISQVSIEELAARGIEFETTSVLELGAGRGGYTEELAKVSKEIVASDIYRARAFDHDLKDIQFQIVDVTQTFPFHDSRFDFVYCSSLVEHIPDRSNLYREISRVLTPEGLALISYPPFWSLSLVGGHQYKPWHLMGESVATRMNSRRSGVEVDSYDHDDSSQKLYPLTVKGLISEVTSHGLHLVDQWPRLSHLNTLRLPGILADLCTWHACFLVGNRPRSN